MAKFSGPVERREKRRSIRAKGDRFKVGGSIQLYTGMRTKACRKLVANDPVCTAVEPITIRQDSVCINGRYLNVPERQALAIADGFEGILPFCDFFLDGSHVFNGFLIVWDWPE
ncbi:hypothetical protein [Devosia sp. Root635]|uniref:hypothetical protein n=1 Tax=Devosia sp. Root635 TaxID=1736575 RepID=UPI0012E35D65|nr:hypothetical protein [Devosia sp. Root635]